MTETRNKQLKIPAGAVDNHFMRLRSIVVRAVAAFALCLPMAVGVGADKADIYDRKAVQLPKEMRETAQHEHADEIDREIAGYFSRVRSSSHVSMDSYEMRKLFGTRQYRDYSTGRPPAEDRTLILYGKDGVITSHEVTGNESLRVIAAKYQLEPEEVLKHNPMLEKRAPYIGEELLIVKQERARMETKSSARHHRVRKGESLGHIAKRYGVSVGSLRRWNGLRKGQGLRPGKVLRVGTVRTAVIPKGYRAQRMFNRPVKGPITSRFGRRYNPFIRAYTSFHKGVDIGVALGTPFQAARSGLVILSRRTSAYGNCIFILHAGGYVTVYAHAKKLNVKKGDIVKRGQVIGEIGRTGHATGPHLHFEVRQWRKAINPLSAMNMTELVPENAAVKTAYR